MDSLGSSTNSVVIDSKSLAASQINTREITINAISSQLQEPPQQGEHGGTQRGPRFWAIIVSLCLISLLASAENTVIVTALPTIVKKLDMGHDYIWVGNIFFLTSAAVQPLLGQIANLFGRRHRTISVVAVYTLGSGICGGANNSTMLIAGRAVQGIGSGGINMIIDVIISDLVPLRDRGYFIAIVLLVYGIGIAIGPFLGGIIVQNTSWRWVFYINLPVGMLTMVTLFLFLRVKRNREKDWWTQLKRIDYTGNGILMGSTVSVLIALTWADVKYPWTSPQIMIPLLVGLAGMVLFAYYESLPFGTEPVMPLRLFATRTSVIVYINTFLNSALIYWEFFFMTLYFQGVRLSSPSQSGIELLVLCLVATPGAAVSSVILARFGKYKFLHITGFTLLTIGMGLFGILDQNTSTSVWVMIHIVPAVGSGMIMNTLLPAFQAPLEESDQAAATAAWSFQRSFGNVWGVAIPAAIFNSYTNKYAETIDSPIARAALQRGDSYASATKAFVESFDEPVRQQIRTVFTLALQKVFLIGIVTGGLALVLSMFEQDVKLRTDLDGEFGLEESRRTSQDGL